MPFKHQQVECYIRRPNSESPLDTSVYAQLKRSGLFKIAYLINLLNSNSQNERCVTQISFSQANIDMVKETAQNFPQCPFSALFQLSSIFQKYFCLLLKREMFTPQMRHVLPVRETGVSITCSSVGLSGLEMSAHY